MDSLAGKAFKGLAGLILAMAVLLFGLPFTFDYWQAWLFLAVYLACSITLTLYMVRNDPKLLERRMRGGPFAEKEPTQRIIMLVASIGFAGLLVVPPLDRRFGWSHISPAVAIAGDVMVALGWLAIYFVFRENSYTSATIELAPDQKVISSGPYAYIRHPMYAGALPMLLGIPIALGSWWAVLSFFVIMSALVWRIFDEEKFLASNLAGYDLYKQKVQYRLIPHLW